MAVRKSRYQNRNWRESVQSIMGATLSFLWQFMTPASHLKVSGTNNYARCLTERGWMLQQWADYPMRLKEGAVS